MSVRTVDGGGSLRIAVVGAGVAGLACAKWLAERGRSVRIFEQESCPGGRVATRRVDSLSFDHGVQYFTTHDARFAPLVRQWEADGIIARWRGRMVALVGRGVGETVDSQPRFVGVPNMEAVAVHLSRGLTIRLGARVEAVRREAGRWRLLGAGGTELDADRYDAIVLAMPSACALPLVDGQSDQAARLASIQWDSCWAVMLGLSRASGIDFDAAFVSDDPILGWIARESSKPMRAARHGATESWILHAHPAWSRAYLDMPEAEASRWMQRAFAARVGRPLVQSTVAAHRWRLALPANWLQEAFLFDERLAIGFAGDWCGGPRVEGAYLSGLALAQAMTS